MRSRAVLEAPAKINLYLEVGPPRPDGYHPVRTVLQAVDICDLLEVEVTEGGEGIRLAVGGDAPAGEDNLCHRAAALFLATTGMRMGINIRLSKRIPQAAGLGGGSADAAAVLRILNFISGEALSREELLRTAASLGMDVPFFLVGGTAMGEGRGERITPLTQAPPLPVLLVNPGETLSTAEVYRRFDLSGGDDPRTQGPDPLVAALPTGDVDIIATLLHNSLQRAACELMPEVGALLEKAAEAGAAGAMVSGSGPTVFVLAASDAESALLEEEMRRHAPVVFRTSFRMAGVSQVG
ncbi:MAG: 4-(cytidine 5'-diphospho)-2-C-methyl-D-erythritol kinase [Actinobacteria bacterium]|nr:4-(cytidine 5'-diphospho)-2-C-methyl-D-erythritol kinase [Actinomycetota bacterium]